MEHDVSSVALQGAVEQGAMGGPSVARLGAIGRGQRVNMAWNAVGSLVFLGCQWLTCVLTARLADDYATAGVFALAMSISNVFASIELYKTRSYQVSDIHERTCGHYQRKLGSQNSSPRYPDSLGHEVPIGVRRDWPIAERLRASVPERRGILDAPPFFRVERSWIGHPAPATSRPVRDSVWTIGKL